ncbi:hypothetical protein EYF80_005991 [Liparis tanakae]|uniref:Uncharacterized protein n=1 Tax=Liparis tanakae TaxID=230148 RepID=A0A4Z2J0G1_9TELE|nr:hypothetical protein EYF80_005991 [Liparis tanakae]
MQPANFKPIKCKLQNNSNTQKDRETMTPASPISATGDTTEIHFVFSSACSHLEDRTQRLLSNTSYIIPFQRALWIWSHRVKGDSTGGRKPCAQAAAIFSRAGLRREERKQRPGLRRQDLCYGVVMRSHVILTDDSAVSAPDMAHQAKRVVFTSL